jgi:hypothetical protein
MLGLWKYSKSQDARVNLKHQKSSNFEKPGRLPVMLSSLTPKFNCSPAVF